MNDDLKKKDEQMNTDTRVITNKNMVANDRITKKKVTNVNVPQQVETEKLQRNGYDYNETFRSAFEFSGIGMALLNTQGKILDANTAFSNFIGYTKQELLRFNFLDLGHPDDNESDKALMNRMFSNFINYYSLEKRYISRYKKVLWGLHTVSKVYNKEGALQFYVLQIVDITRRKELNDELNRKNSELEAIKTGLINKITQLEELNHIIAHNLRGPANNIRLLVEMLKEKAEDKDSSGLRLETDEIVSYLDEGSNSLLGSLNALLEVVQISMNKNIPFVNCDVQQIVREILEQLNTIIFEKAAFMQLDMGVPEINYPKVFLESIFYNLISNALKYTHPDRTPEILIRTYRADDKTVISVKDNGLGIDLVKYGGKIFKLNQVFHDNPDSKGVGLYITKAQVESFGGKIEVRSRENEGSEFLVTV